MKLIKDGNFSPWLRALIWATGLILAALFYCFATGEIMFWGVIISTAIAAIGAYSEAANTLRLKPFDNEYKKAKRSYTNKEDHS
ncbi:hypothetical protein ACXX82_02485 [Glaciimonas sp. GNP009]